MSVIETPPKDRLAIQTTVSSFSETLVQRVIEEEMAREGQVFFVHNRVESIASLATMMKRLVPKARVVVGHGQMRGERARKSDAEIYSQRSGRAGLDHDYRKRAGHPAREYDHHQSRGPNGAFGAVPASRARGTFEPARLCVFAGAAGGDAHVRSRGSGSRR